MPNQPQQAVGRQGTPALKKADSGARKTGHRLYLYIPCKQPVAAAMNGMEAIMTMPKMVSTEVLCLFPWVRVQKWQVYPCLFSEIYLALLNCRNVPSRLIHQSKREELAIEDCEHVDGSLLYLTLSC
jgi:hypothetical protein